MRRNYLILLSILMIVTLTTGLEMPPVKQGENTTLRQTCGSCTYVNITIYYPNSSAAVKNAAMENIGGGYWEYNFSDTGAVGRYDYPTCGDISGTHTCSSSEDPPSFYVTYNGQPIDESRTYLNIFLILLFAGFGGFLIYLARLLPNDNVRDNENRAIQVSWLKYLRFPFWGISYLSFTAVMWISANLGMAYLGSGIGNVLYVIAWVMITTTLPMMVVFVFKIFDDARDDIQFKRDLGIGVERGY